MESVSKTNIIFILEGNFVYAKMLEEFLRTILPAVEEIRSISIEKINLLEFYQRPTVIIIDPLPNSIHPYAAPDLSIIKRIKNANPGANIILLGGQKEFDLISKTTSRYGCKYVPKDKYAFAKVANLIKGFLYNKVSI